MRESRIPNAGHTIRNLHGSQTFAPRESRPPNAGYTIRNLHESQTFAFTESTNPNAGHTIRNFHGSQTAITESILPNAVTLLGISTEVKPSQ